MPDFIDDGRISESMRISKVAYVAAEFRTSCDDDGSTIYRQVSKCRLYLRGVVPSSRHGLDCTAITATYFSFRRWNNSHEPRSTQLWSSLPSSRTAQTAVPVKSMGR